MKRTRSSGKRLGQHWPSYEARSLAHCLLWMAARTTPAFDRRSTKVRFTRDDPFVGEASTCPLLVDRLIDCGVEMAQVPCVLGNHKQ